jgi:hypothetical protein
MNILCGNRKLVSNSYGWILYKQITLREKSRTPGRIVWKEEQPAHPGTLSQGLYMIYERLLKEQGDIHVCDFPEACLRASEKVREYAKAAGATIPPDIGNNPSGVQKHGTG